uniref:Sulfhydryl oxidase n=1 Tax=Mimiviridae sp. ChoanoV1 TaxID=2596887 RepID=A0A5B8IR31_9VIRU|nr:hypothetical protein 10_5 [Mimiviridae sp. ChoanoV1]
MSKKNNLALKCVFKENDFNSADGMLTYVWGPSLWHFLHTMSFNYPVKPTREDKMNYLNFMNSLKSILPCKYCRINLKKNFRDTKFSIKKLKDRKTFSKYIYELHNHINKMLGKKITISYDEVRNRYENFRSRCSDKNNKNNKNNKSNKSINYKCKNSKNCKKICKCLSNKKTVKKEKGCTNPINGIKSKCLIRIVPLQSKKKTFNMDPKCQATISKK